MDTAVEALALTCRGAWPLCQMRGQIKCLRGWVGGSTASKTHEAKAELALGYFRAYSYYSRTGETTTTSDPSTATLLHIRLPRQNSASTETSRAGEEITWGPGLRACKGPLIRGRPMSLLPPGIPHAAVFSLLFLPVAPTPPGSPKAKASWQGKRETAP
jgi:hypothetical protein